MQPLETQQLLDQAEEVLRRALGGDVPQSTLGGVQLPGRPPTAPGVFVTLEVGGALNGCVGHVPTEGPLDDSVRHLALAAAFDDPRLPRLAESDLDRLQITISVLSPLEPIPSRSRRDVLDHLEPEVHGLSLSRGRHRALFLPTVWESLPDGEDFLDQLLTKAGLHPHIWPEGIGAWRFTTTTATRLLEN